MLITKNGLPDSKGILATDIQETASQIFMTNKKNKQSSLQSFIGKVIRKPPAFLSDSRQKKVPNLIQVTLPNMFKVMNIGKTNPL